MGGGLPTGMSQLYADLRSLGMNKGCDPFERFDLSVRPQSLCIRVNLWAFKSQSKGIPHPRVQSCLPEQLRLLQQ
jgi:hypothetical protein